MLARSSLTSADHQRRWTHEMAHQRTILSNNPKGQVWRRFGPMAVGMVMMLLLLLLATLALQTERAEALNCYTCSSMTDPGCDESFTSRANYSLEDTDCDKHISEPAKVCRKLVQYIEHKKVVIRSCGWLDSHEPKDRKDTCYKRSGTFAIMMESCNCYTDNCNHSASLVPNDRVLAPLAFVSCLLAALAAVSSRGRGATSAMAC